MDQETLLKFIQRIITTSRNEHQSSQALRELESILKKQGIPETHRSLIESAIQGTDDSIRSMNTSISSLQVLTPEELHNAVTRAHEAKLREEEARRNGRC